MPKVQEFRRGPSDGGPNRHLYRLVDFAGLQGRATLLQRIPGFRRHMQVRSMLVLQLDLQRKATKWCGELRPRRYQIRRCKHH